MPQRLPIREDVIAKIRAAFYAGFGTPGDPAWDGWLWAPDAFKAMLTVIRLYEMAERGGEAQQPKHYPADGVVELG